MRKVVLAVSALVAAASLAAFAGGATGAAGGEGPPCANITAETHNFPVTGTTYLLRMQVQLAAPACVGRIAYRVFVETDSGTFEATLTDYSAEGYPQFEYQSSDSTICVYATTSPKGGKTYDRAPDANADPNCLALPATGGQGGFH